MSKDYHPAPIKTVEGEGSSVGVEIVTKLLRVAGDLPRCPLVEPSQAAAGKARTSPWHIPLPLEGGGGGRGSTLLRGICK